MAVPKLRFKEFDGAFSKNTIKKLAKIYVGRDLVEGAYSPIKTETHIYPIYSNSVDNEGLYGYYNFEEFNFDNDALTVVGRGAGLGKAFYRRGGFGTIGRLLSLTPKDKSFHPKYMSDYINDKLIIHNESGGIPQLPRSSLENYEVVLPSYEEQTKIAFFLSAVDEKISQFSQKKTLLSQYKQGMMQKLFSQQIRFKADDGSEFGEWEETFLHTFLCESLIKGSKGNKAKKLTVKLWGKGVIPKNEAFQGSENTQYYKRSAGQLIYGKLDFLNCAFGLIPEYLDGFESTIDAPAFDIDNKIVHPYFLINRFLQKDFYQKNGEEADGSRKAKRINQSVFLAMQIDLPSLEEQIKIANFLSSLDQKIEVVAQQIEQAKQWKKGLLQQMFV